MPRSNSAKLSRFPDALTLLIILVIASSPLVWVRYAANLTLYHALGLLLLAVLPLQREFLTSARAVLRKDWAIWAGFAAMFIWPLALSFRATPPFEFERLGKELYYLAVGFALAIGIVIVMRRERFHHLWVLALATVASTFVFAGLALLVLGLNPLYFLQIALATGDPNQIIYPIFLRIFGTGLEDGLANRRHTLALAFLAAIAISPLAWRCLPSRKGLLKALGLAGLIAAWIMVIFSFSRSTWLAAALMFAIILVPSISSPRRVGWVLVGFFVAFGALLASALLESVAALIGGRLSQTQSYEARAGALAERWRAIGEDPMWGTVGVKQNDWAHNVMIDMWANAGFVGFVIATLVMLAIAKRIAAGIFAAATSRPRAAAFQATAAALMVPIFVRFYTVPGVQFEIGTWIALGLGSGIATHLQMSATRRRRSGLPSAHRSSPARWGAPHSEKARPHPSH